MDEKLRREFVRALMPFEKIAHDAHELRIQKKRGARNVYFILDDGLIKVGFSEFPENRLLQIKTARPSARLIGYIPGGAGLEKEIHRKLAKYKFDKEWFYYTFETREIVSQYLRGNK